MTTTDAPVIGSLCTGYGGLDLGVLAALGGGRIAWVSDNDPHIAQLLAACMPDVPNLGDLRHVDWRAVEPVDVLVAGFPCQDISAAGKRAGIEKGTRSGLWTDIVAGLRLLRPTLVVLENVAALRWRNGGLHRVLGDLAQAGYDALWRSVRASDIGAAHRRERVFLLAWRRALRTLAAAAHPDGQLLRAHPRPLPHPAPQRIRRTTTPDQRPRGAGGNDSPPAHPTSLRHRISRPQSRTGLPPAAVATGAPARDAANVAAHPTRDGRHQGMPRATREQGRPDAPLGHHPTPHSDRRPSGRYHLVAVPGPTGDSTASHTTGPASETVDWGVYETAVRRWEAVLGRPAPHPTQPGSHGRPVLAPTFVEHLMGLPSGWVTDLPLPRTAQLRALGNGVVPQQAAHAVSLLLDDLDELLKSHRHHGEEVLAA
ncbi:DNA cytosine methyltransferase [Saccharothrix variisporea]|uniref:DNA (cytosine-5-)-methyltransferase n=1 Tax=Saccharothrix variisporea TaxID=543527 RepID=A0A495XDA3_9PSEU|nr:DNA cytosine methyltransferase [Saccharothrix variisporea]RKT69518.1 DNA (cytosine-5)-methyltransferase 1 [Saccharothrix variisporea]